MTYIFEIVGQNRRLFYGSLLIAATHFGGAVACICAYLSSNKFQHIFMLAGLIGLLSLKGRAMLTETYVQKESKNMIFSKYNSSNSTVCSYLNVIAASSCLIFIFFTIMIYCNKIIIQKFAIDMQTVFFINLVLHLVWVIFLPIVGIISDRYSIPIVRIMRTGSIATICIGIPALIFGYHSENIKIFMIAQLLVTLTHIIFCMPTPKMICSFFTINVRNTHVSFSYGIGVSITAAFMPILNDFFYNNFSIYGTTGLIAVFATLGFVSTIGIRDNG